MIGAAHTPNGVEFRTAAAEVRAASGGRKVEGYAATFHTEARIADRWTETLLPGCFASSLADRDILLLKDHDERAVLGRSRAGSLRLSENGKGLWFEADLPNTTAANDTLELVRAGLAGGCSFGFTVPAGGERWSGDRREIRNLTLHEVSIVSAWPAFEGTSVAARARRLTASPGASAALRRRLQMGAL